MEFRVYDNKCKEWTKENICLRPDGKLMLIKRSLFSSTKFVLLPSDRYICHRSIDLYDNNNTLVHEGDYIQARVAEDRTVVGLVAFAHELSAWVILCVDSDVFYTLGSDVSSEIQVIGNVFDGYNVVNSDGKQTLSGSKE